MTILETSRGAITIRPAQPDDVEAYRALRLQALAEHPTAFGSDYETSAALSLDHWRERIVNTPQKCSFVAVSESGLVGMAVVERNDLRKMRHNSSLQGVFVQPEWRGLGIIDALVEASVTWAREQGALIMRLAVNARNAAAVGAYLRCGFAIYGVEPMLLYVDGVYYDEIIMSRML